MKKQSTAFWIILIVSIAISDIIIKAVGIVQPMLQFIVGIVFVAIMMLIFYLIKYLIMDKDKTSGSKHD